MRYSILMLSAVGLALLVSGSPASADEVEELERKALSQQKEAARLYEKGREEEAHDLERESGELLLKVRQLQQAKQERSAKSDGDRAKKSGASDPGSQHLEKLLYVRLMELDAALRKAEARNAAEPELDEIREQMRVTMRKLAHPSEPLHSRPKIPQQFRAHAEKLENAARRLQHIRVAAENLKAAEMHDMAHELMKQADSMEQEMQAAKLELVKLMRAGDSKDPEPKGELQQLRSENEQLRREMKEQRDVIEQLRKKTDD